MSLNITTANLYREIGLSHTGHIPPNQNTTHEGIKWYDRNGRFVGMFTVHVIPSAGYFGVDGRHCFRQAIKARVYVVCPNCGKKIPAGRWFQHDGSARCMKRAMRNTQIAVAAGKAEELTQLNFNFG